jgi:zinc protease
MRYLLLLLPALVLAAIPAGEPRKGPAKVVQLQLDNGLTVILRPIDGAKDTALVVLRAIGGDHDPRDRSGMAHLLEHLQCTSAADDFPARPFPGLAKRYPRGRQFRAGDRYTVHAMVFPAADLARELKELAARMADLKITADDLAREVPRIEEEHRKRAGAAPALAAAKLVREKVRPAPLGGSAGGVLAHIKAMTLEELRQRWADHYRAEGAIVAVAGAVDVDEARKAIATHFGRVPRGKKPPPAEEPGKPVLGQVDEIEVKPALAKAQAAFCVAFRAPRPGSDMYAPFLVAVARMQVNRAKLDANPNHTPIVFGVADDPEVVYLHLSVGKKQTAKQLLLQVKDFLQDIGEGDVTAGDRQAARLLWGWGLGELPEAVLADNVSEVAFGLSRRVQLGLDPEGLGKALAAVTTKDVQRVLREVFTEDQSAAVLARPQ